MSARATEAAGSLDAFFARMTRFLFEDGSVDDVRALGASPSGDERFAFYRSLVRGNPRRVMRSCYRGTGALAAHLFGEGGAAFFEALIERHLVVRPPRGWCLPSLTQGFSETLTELQQAGTLVEGRAIPELLLEVADFEELRQRTLVLDVGPEEPGRPHPTAEVRSYTFDVPGYAKRARETAEGKGGGVPVAVAPGGEPVTRVFFRHPETGRLATLSPTLADLVAIAAASGEADPDTVKASGVTDDDLRAARAHLEAKGVLVPR